MKTKNLLLLALGCGVAILLSGAAMVWRISHQDATTTSTIGTPTRVGDMTVTVDDAHTVDDGDGVTVDITIGGAEDPQPAGDFRLFVGDVSRPVDHSNCPAATTEFVNCLLWFPLDDGDAGALLLAYRRGDQRAVWLLDRASE